MTRRHVWMGLLAAVAAGVTLGLWPRPLGPAPEIGWEIGKQYRYAVRLELQQDTTLGGLAAEKPVSGSIGLEGALLVRAHGKRDGAYVLGLGLGDVKRLDLAALGARIDAPKDLGRHEAVLEMLPTGEIRSISTAPDMPAPLASLLEHVASHLQVRLDGAAAARWQLEEDTPLGRARSEYDRSRTRPEGVDIERRRAAYGTLLTFEQLGRAVSRQDVTSALEARIRPGGPLLRLSSREQLAAEGGGVSLSVVSEVALALEAVTPFSDPGIPAGIAARRLGAALVLPKDTPTGAPAGMRYEEVVAGIRALAPEGSAGQAHNRWLWQAMGLLQAEPALCRRLIEVFKAADLPERNRLLVLELLAAVGHETAQEVMRELLDRKAFPDTDLEHARRIQRLSFLDAPTSTTAHWLSEAHRDGKGDVRLAAAYALGAVISQSGEEPTLQRALNEELVAALERSSDVDEQAHYLAALGNAGLGENHALVAKYAHDASPLLRDAAARALRKTPDARSQDLLVELAGDRNHEVQHAAVLTLQRQEPDQARITALGGKILGGQIAPANYALALRSLQHLADLPLRQRVARHMLAHAPKDDDLKGRISELLAGT